TNLAYASQITSELLTIRERSRALLFGSVSVLIPAGSGGGRKGLPLLGTHDDEPQHDRELAEHHWENPIGDPLLIVRPQNTGYARSQIGEAVEHQPGAEDARKEPRPVHQQAEGKQPESPKYLVRKYPLAMHAEEHNGEGVALRLVEDREEICPAGEGR